MKRPNRQLYIAQGLPGYPTIIAGREYLMDAAGTVHRLEAKVKGKAQAKRHKQERMRRQHILGGKGLG